MIKYGNLISSYTEAQQKRLQERGGGSVINKPKYRDVVTNQSAIDSATEANKKDQVVGKLSAEEIRNKFGLSYNEEHANSGGGSTSKYGGRDDGAIFSTDTGEYIGTIDGFKARTGKNMKDRAKGIDPFKAVQDYELEQGFRDNSRKKWNGMNDVAGAVNNVFGENTKLVDVPEAITEKQKVEYSPKVQQAMERAAKFENDRNSGKFNDDFYAKYDYKSRDAFNQQSDEYQPIDLNTNVSSIETTGSQTSAQDATKYFLENKKSQLKAKRNFQPIEFRA